MADEGCGSARKNIQQCSTSGAIYGLGMIGAAVYFIQHSTGFWMGVLGVIKAIIWPAMIVYKALELLKL
ncbi:MAG: hypothetical protein ACOZB3_05480 [Calditrichota bacterium]